MSLRYLSLSPSQPIAILKSEHSNSSDCGATVWDEVLRRAGGSAFCSLPMVLEGTRTALQDRVTQEQRCGMLHWSLLAL